MAKLLGRTSVAVVVCVAFWQAGCAKNQDLTLEMQNRRPVAWVNESARNIPVAYDVDVVVVGGTSGGVAAAVAAAQQGAKVFLAAERPYLGEDLCGTYRLWLEPGEEPDSLLAERLFADPAAAHKMRNAIPFAYVADKPSAGVHKDTQPPSLLADGKWHSAASQSVQYDGNVTITADLGGDRQVERACVMAYQRDNDFEAESATIYISQDSRQWKQIAVVKNEKLGQGSFEESAVELSAPVSERVRYVKFVVEKSPEVHRILLGEILIEAKQGPDKSAESRCLPPTPMHIKRTLDEALLQAGVEFLFGCYTTDVLYDSEGKLAGIVMANRSGRQAVKAKVIVDATPRASVARMAGAMFRPYPGGPQTFKRVVVRGEAIKTEEVSAHKMPTPLLTSQGAGYEAIEYTLKIAMADGSFASFAEAEQFARDKTWHPKQGDDSETLFQVPPDPMKGRKSLPGVWPGGEKVSLDVFRPAGISRLFVLGGCADVPRDAAEKLLRPLELITVGSRIGAAAVSEAGSITKLSDVKLPGNSIRLAVSGEILENLAWRRPTQTERGSILAEARAVPVVGQYDVVVVGGGTGGAPAGIGAARQGARTLVIEYLHGLGGVGTLGLIGKYYYGYREGFTKEVDQGLAEFGGKGEGDSGKGQAWNSELKMELYRRMLRKAGADIWFGVLGCGALVEDGQVKGVVVATPDGRGVVIAKVVIDSTGNVDIAAAAGADCVYTNGHGLAVQGAGLPPQEIGARYTNTDWTFIDDTDVVDVWHAFVVAKKKYQGAYDLGQLIDTRERRRIVGDFVLSPLDVYLGRTFADTIVLARSNFDTHGFTVHPMFMLRPPDREVITAYVPYRCLLPKGLDGILATGLGVSADRDVMPVIRMQADIQNQGYAAGVAAAMAVKSGKSLRDIDIEVLQKHLVEKGNLPKEALDHQDTFALPKEQVEKAVETVTKDFDGLEVIFAQPEQALPLLRKAYQSAENEDAKLIYAHILATFGEAIGAEVLLAAVKAKDWDKGWNFTGMGQFGASMSPLDSLMIALGGTGDRRAVDVIVEKLAQLDAKSEFSHFRAVAMALETLAVPAAAKPLAELLIKPGMTGYAFTDIEQARHGTPDSPADTSTRNCSLRELFLAQALYRCGDYEGLGEKILKEYERDLRGHYARHAHAVLGKETPH